MKKILFVELARAFKNKLFIYALFLGSAVTVWHFIQYVLPMLSDFENSASYMIKIDPMFIPGTLFGQWIGGNSVSVQSFLYYLFLPIIATIPFADSFFCDRKGGFIKNVLIRTKKRDYYIAKFTATFLVAGTVVVIPLLLNLALSAMILPAMLPQPASHLFSINGISLWGDIFLFHPFVYIFIYMLITFIFGGLFAAFALIVSFYVEYRFIVLISPFLVYLFTSAIFNLFEGGIRFEPINFLTPSFGMSSANIIFGEIIILALITVVPFFLKGVKNDTI